MGHVESRSDWHIGLSAWVIQDGNYDDFSVGQRAEFALEFSSPDPLQTGGGEERRARRMRDALYDISGVVTTARADAWVVDFGLQAYQERRPPEDVRVGGSVNGIIYLGVDPFFYFERLANVEGFPPLVYTWNIVEITRLAASTAEGPQPTRGAEPYVRDERVNRTNAWEDDDGGVAEYVLTCQLVDVPSRRTIGTRR